MSGPVVCGLEDAASVVGATLVARTLAERFELPLMFVHVVEPGQRAVDDVRSVLSLRQAVDALEPASDATWRVEAGHPADRLLAVAEDCRASSWWSAVTALARRCSAASPPTSPGGLLPRRRRSAGRVQRAAGLVASPVDEGSVAALVGDGGVGSSPAETA